MAPIRNLLVIFFETANSAMSTSEEIPPDGDIVRLTQEDMPKYGIDPSLLPTGFALLFRKDANGVVLPIDLRLGQTQIGNCHVYRMHPIWALDLSYFYSTFVTTAR